MSRSSFCAVAMSGGVDSSAAALLLLERGDSPIGVTFRMFPESGENGARQVCDALGIPFTEIDLSRPFAEAVMADFRREYEAGRTPNPCVACNREIKFPYLLRFAEEAGCGRMATGHYARIVRCGSRYSVAKAVDAGKDQSYMLWGLTQEILARTDFPLGDYTKAQIREIAAARTLPTAAAKESQDICFIPDGDYAAYLARCGMQLPDGHFTDEDGRILGASKNQACYTVGQRRGLGIALGHPMFVCARDAAANRTVISSRDPYAGTVEADSVQYLAAAPGELDRPVRCTVKIRYTRAEHACIAEVRDGILTVRLDEGVRAPSPGQSLVLYDGDTVLAGGLIRSWQY